MVLQPQSRFRKWRPFRSIRWKLTLTYTLATILTLLILEAGVLALLLVFVSSDLFPRRVVYELEGLASQVAPYMINPQQQDELQQWVEAISRPNLSLSAGDEGLYITSAPLGGNGQLFVLDTHYRILATTSDQFSVGLPLRPNDVPGLFPLLRNSLEGESTSTRRPDGLLLAAVPVQEDNGEILGILAIALNFPSTFRVFYRTLVQWAGRTLLLLIGPVSVMGTVAGVLVSRSLSRRLQRLSRVVSTWQRGDLTSRIADQAQDELGALARYLDQMVTRLQDLLVMEKELAALEERKRMARDLHDGLKQRLFALHMQVVAAQHLVKRGQWEKVSQRLSDMGTLIEQAKRELTEAIYNLQPREIEEGLIPGIREFLEEWSRTHAIRVACRITGVLSEPPPAVRRALLKILQEALNNVARHSEAEFVQVILAEKEGRLRMSVVDEGKGFDISRVDSRGKGLHFMQERAWRLGGQLTIESAPHRGTRVTVWFPVEKGEG